MKKLFTKLTLITSVLSIFLMVAKDGALAICNIDISPTSESVYTEETIQFSANVSGDCNTPCYNWEVMGDSGGIIDASGLYTAGDIEGTDTVTVIDNCNSDILDTADVIVSNEP